MRTLLFYHSWCENKIKSGTTGGGGEEEATTSAKVREEGRSGRGVKKRRRRMEELEDRQREGGVENRGLLS